MRLLNLWPFWTWDPDDYRFKHSSLRSRFYSGLFTKLAKIICKMHFRNLEEFWAFYMNQHSKASTRRWHFCGMLAAGLFLLAAFLIKWWLGFFAPIFGYGLAWYSHFFIEGNVPASFGHPVWSLLCDFKMFGLMLTGQMDREIKRLGKRPILQVL